MKAAAILEEAEKAGVRVVLNGDEARLKAPAKPPDDLLEKLRAHKPEIIALLKAEAEFEAMRPAAYTDAQWRAALTDAARLGYGYNRRVH